MRVHAIVSLKFSHYLSPAFVAGQEEGREHCIHLHFYDLHASSCILLNFNYEVDSVTNKQFYFFFIYHYLYARIHKLISIHFR